MPQFSGKVDGIAFNVPVPNGSCVDLTTELNRILLSKRQIMQLRNILIPQ
ncbi:hypothetical protein Ct9H90mP29_12910 [bacterium]|nr:MAG: hypothetical protein Ct9H90mP29_12910 [bacterium]